MNQFCHPHRMRALEVVSKLDAPLTKLKIEFQGYIFSEFRHNINRRRRFQPSRFLQQETSISIFPTDVNHFFAFYPFSSAILLYHSFFPHPTGRRPEALPCRLNKRTAFGLGTRILLTRISIQKCRAYSIQSADSIFFLSNTDTLPIQNYPIIPKRNVRYFL